jgi:uncharacterized repeat protein (TIGR01451 family)
MTRHAFIPLLGRGKHLRRWVAVTLLLCLSSCQAVPRIELPLGTDTDTEQATGTAQTAGYSEPATDADAVVVSDGPSLERIPTGVQIAQAVEKSPHMPVEPQDFQGEPIPLINASPWAPPGIAGPWPRDEYLEDGGDNFVQVNVGPQGEVRGLELEDTVAIYDTKDGRTLIKPSNKVCLYAPRFAAVRHVASVIENQQNDQLIGINQPLMPHQGLEDRLATTAVQPIRPQGGIATRQPSIERTNEVGLPTISLQPILGIESGLAIYENLLVMKRGVFEESEKSRLLEGIDAAIVWTHNAAVQVVLDGKKAVDVTGDQRAQATYRYDEPNSPCLRIIKIASKKVAKPGEIVDFTIRFDNLGDQTIKRVVLIDNLTTRLEYVPTTAQSSLRADFTTEVNDGDSLVLRWDFADPLPPGEGGLVRFNCKVR